MAQFTRRKNTEAAPKAAKPEIAVYGIREFTVGNVREWTNGGVTFDLTLNGELTIYGCRLAAKADGEAFVSLPSRKGNDGKYYKHLYLKFSDQDQDKICQRVLDALNG